MYWEAVKIDLLLLRPLSVFSLLILKLLFNLFLSFIIILLLVIIFVTLLADICIAFFSTAPPPNWFKIFVIERDKRQ